VAVAVALIAGDRPAAADDPPRVPVDELPPIPDTGGEDDVAGLAATSAARAEEELVVGASKREQSLGTVASAVTVITADRLRRWGYRTVAEALRGVVGLYIVDDRDIERIGIRGIQLLGDANTRILILIDGTPLNEPWSQYVDASAALPIPIDGVARIEVIRGPVSSIYGTNAFLGIINIVSRGADEAPNAYGRIDASTFGVATATAGFARGGVHRQVRGFVAADSRGGETVRYPDYQPPVQTFDPQTDADGATAVRGGLVVHYDGLFFQLRGASRTRELPGAPFDATFGSDRTTNRDRLLITEAGYARDLAGQITVTGRLYGNLYQHAGNLDRAPENPFRTEGSAAWLGGELRALFDLDRAAEQLRAGAELAATVGVTGELSKTSSSAFDPGAPDPTAGAVDVDRSFDIAGLYGEVTGRVPLAAVELAATAGLRYDRNSEFDNNLSPRVALFLNRGGRYGSKLLFAEGFRNPSIFEAFFEDEQYFRPTCSPDCDGGTTLSPEKIRSFEGVLWGRPLPGLKLRLSAWQWKLERLLEKLRVFDPQLLETVIQFGNTFVDVTSRGVELELTYRDTRGWLGFASATAARVSRGDDDATNAPELTGKLGVSTPAIRRRVHLSGELAFIGSRRTRAADVTADPHVGLNLVAYAPDLGGFDLTVGARNILGTREQIPAQADYDRSEGPVRMLLIPGPGRELFVRLGHAF
jgi:iron complex outermembrane receptor protein